MGTKEMGAWVWLAPLLLWSASAVAQTPAPTQPSGANGVQVEVEAPPAASPVVVAPSVQDADYNVRLRAIEERVNQLKEKIFQSKARLIQLQEVVLHGTLSGSKAVIVHRNEMGSSFRLARVQYALDGAPIYNRADNGSGDLEAEEEIEIFSGSIAPGNHQISVYLEYKGYGYGVFSYLRGYTFKIKSSTTFVAEEGKISEVRVVGYEQGGITTELKDRPTVRYDMQTTQDLSTKTGTTEKPASNP